MVAIQVLDLYRGFGHHAVTVDTATVEIWLSFSPGERHRSAVLDSKVLAAVGGLGLDLVLDAYPPGRRRA